MPPRAACRLDGKVNDYRRYNGAMNACPVKLRLFRFRLMLLLLAITLFASLLAWRNAVEQSNMWERRSRQMDLEHRLENRLKRLENARRQYGAGSDDEISALRKKIEELKK
jgi:hypothetical protein